MLLLFLSIFFQYDLLHCGKKANGKDEFMDYSITEFWWNSTPGIDQTGRITPQYSFLPTPIGHGKLPGMMNPDNTPYPRTQPTTPVEELETFFPFPNMTRPSYPFQIENYTVVAPSRPGPPSLPESWHIQYPGLTPPPNFPSDYRYPTVFPYTFETAYIPSPTGPTPKGPSFTLPEVDRPKFTFPTSPAAPKYPPGYDPDWVPPSTTPRPEYSPLTWDPVAPHVKKWKQEITSFAAADSRTPTNGMPTHSQLFNYDYKTEGFPEGIRRVSKIIQDAGSKLKNSVFEDQTRSILREEITEVERKEARDSVFEDEVSSYDPAIKKTTPRKNESKFLRVMKMLDGPATIPEEERRQSDQTVTMTPTTVKELLRQITVTQSYFKMIETLQEGYMTVFLIELTRLVATKERKAVRDVVKHTDRIIYGLYQSGQLRWLGTPLIDVTSKVARLLKELDIDIVQKHAANWHHMLSQRHQELSVEVNTVLEYADMLYGDDEGRILFEALKEFAAYPNISLTSYWLCNSLIHNFLRPYRRFKDTQQRQELVDSVNLILKTRFSSSELNNETPPRHGDFKQANGPPDETKHSTQKEPVTQTEPHSDTIRSPRKRKRKRHHRLHKRKRERKRYKDTNLT